ncbi:MAG: hypothetical protein Q9222_005830 [Ikaeria aurantiellina]
MPLQFRAVSDFLQALEDNAASTKRAMRGWLDQKNKDTIQSWIKSHRVTVDSADVDAVAVLSAIFPDKRTDRVYGLQAPSLSKILGRALRLGSERVKQLSEWKTTGHGDLGLCVERTLRETEHDDVRNPVSLDQVDTTLFKIAAKCRFSARAVRDVLQVDGAETCKLLESIYLRLSSTEAKWFTRMILKDYSTLDFKTFHVLNAIDSRLAESMNVHDSFDAAVGLLRHQRLTADGRSTLTAPFRPIVGSKIGRVPYLKGRSVKNVVQLAQGRKMSVERKYDGEYCQIHINLAKGNDCLQLFSKSGKDSTLDRKSLHEAIRQSLRIGKPDSKFSRAHDHEHLMIAFYDVMLVDDDAVMNEPHTARRRRLQDMVTCIRGRATLAKHKLVDFSSPEGPERLKTLLAHAIAQRWEGLVLKPSDDPYFGFKKAAHDPVTRGWIKLKRDYIPGLGDTLDFAIVGGGYDASRAGQLHCPKLKWTRFYMGCLRNKKEVVEKKAKPCFRIVGALDTNLEMTKHLNQHGQFSAVPLGSLKSYQDPFLVDPKEVASLDVVFRKPFAAEVVGAGFDKDSNHNFYTLRFPRVLKIHSDRDWKTCVGFSELQETAVKAKTVPADTKAEVTGWMQQLEEVDRGKKGAHVPWDLSEDDIEMSDITRSDTLGGHPISRRNKRRASPIQPMIRMDSHEMKEQEQRLDSGEVVQKPSQRSYITNWSESNLPTPPRSSPAHGGPGLNPRPPLASLQSTNATDRSRKHSSEVTEIPPDSMPSKRRRVSPPAKRPKEAGTSATTRPLANNNPPQATHKSDHHPPHPSFLVPKLPVGAAEAIRSRSAPQPRKVMEQTSPDRATTADEASASEDHSSQQSLIADWQLHDVETASLRRFSIPDLDEAHMILSLDVAGMPYLTQDLLNPHGIPITWTTEAILNDARKSSERGIQFQGLFRKDVIILIEKRRHNSSLAMLKKVVGHVPKDESQVLWVFDWRLLEDLHVRGIVDDEKLLHERLEGRFWYEDGGVLKWMTYSGEVRVVPEENIRESREM